MSLSFSISDAIKLLEVVATVIDALQAHGRQSSEHRALLSQLRDLETVLQGVKSLEIEDAPLTQTSVLNAVARHCQQTIEDFWKRFGPRDGHLQRTGSSSLRERWAKIKWAILYPDDIQKFKIDLLGHTSTISVLLNSVQLSSLKICHEEQKKQASQAQDSYLQILGAIRNNDANVSLSVTHGTQLLIRVDELVRKNMQILQSVIKMQHMLTRIPGQQIETQQPVFLLDAMGKPRPFHLEFIQSFSALKDVLIRLFEPVGAADKIRDDEFVITDIASRKDIDSSADWTTNFSPGQRVKMSMVFSVCPSTSLKCPKCGVYNGVLNIEIECSHCGLFYSRVEEVEAAPDHMVSNTSPNIGTSQAQSSKAEASTPSERKRKRTTVEVGPEKFRNVRLKHTMRRHSPNTSDRAGPGQFKKKRRRISGSSEGTAYSRSMPFTLYNEFEEQSTVAGKHPCIKSTGSRSGRSTPAGPSHFISATEFEKALQQLNSKYDDDNSYSEYPSSESEDRHHAEELFPEYNQYNQ